jgi:hypothetical protein
VTAADADNIDSPELRAARAFEPLLDDAYRLAGLHRRTPEDVARDLAASRARAEEAVQRSAANERAVVLGYAVAMSGRTGAL